MPDHFTSEDRRLIRARLIAHAERLFATEGVRATKVSDLAKAVGIAKGSFYSFFQSKEAILAEILDATEKREREWLLLRLAEMSSPSRDAVGDLVLESLRRAMANPLLAAIFRDEEFNSLFRRLPEEAKDHLVSSDVAFAAQILTILADKGLEPSVSPAVAAGLFKCVFVALAAPAQIGQAVHGETVERLSRAVAAAIFQGGIR
jgi:AcrR family transcriptional regulator